MIASRKGTPFLSTTRQPCIWALKDIAALRKLKWSEEIIKAAGIDKDKLPKLNHLIQLFIGRAAAQCPAYIGVGASCRLHGAAGHVFPGNNMEILADVLNVEFRMPDCVEEATAIGAAVIAGVGVGVFDGFEEVKRFDFI